MTTVQNHIKELLFEQDCVVIPDFGGFITNFDCAKINSTKKNISPPQKWLAFNALLKNDDGLLSNFIAKEENISIHQANSKIKTFVEEIKGYLRFDNSYSIEGLGSFSQNEEDKIQFQPKLNNNFYGESFGMENIFLKSQVIFQSELQVIVNPKNISDHTVQQVFSSDDREPMAEVLEDDTQLFRKKRRSIRVLYFGFGLLFCVLLVSSIYLYDNQKSNLSSFNPFLSQSIIQPVLKPFVKEESSPITAKVEDNSVSKQLVETKKTPIEPTKIEISEPENCFFIIIGSFGSKQNAIKMFKLVKNSGFDNAEIIYPKQNENLIKVSAAGFNNQSMAELEAKRVAEVLKQSTWIYRK